MKKKKSRQHQNFFQKNFFRSWDYIKESQNYIYVIIGVFVFSILIGAFVQFPESFVQKIISYLQELLLQTQGLSWFQLTKFIFLNNVQSSFVGMIFGIVLGIYSVITSLANGFILGFVSLLAVREGGVSVLWKILPHGIFELPALFISLGMGLKLGTFIFQKKKIESFKKYLLNSLRVFVFVVLPLLVVAAIIEGILISFVG